MTRHVKDLGGAACTVLLESGDELVASALESDCDGCRQVCNVGAPAKKVKPGDVDLYAVKPTISYEPKPYPGAETALAEKQAKVDGR